MSIATKTLGLLVLVCAAGTAEAQQQPAAAPPPTKSTAQSEAGDPRADTSNSTTAGPAPAAAPAPSAAKPSTGPASAARSPAGRAAPGSGPGQQSAARTDRLELGTATVTGDREQPKVMYIVPWKRSDIGDLAGKPMNSLVDEILAPVDRDVFKREVVYYRAVQAEASQNGAPLKPAPQGEK